MPRQKAAAPQRLDEERRQEQNWNLNQAEASNSNDAQHQFHELVDLIDDAVDNYDSEDDVEYIPKEPRVRGPRAPRASSKKKAPVEEVDEELQSLLDTSAFCVSVVKNPEDQEWRALLGSFEFQLQNGTCELENHSELWIYVSRVPERNFVFVDKKNYHRITDISKTDFHLLKAFEHGSIGSKRRNIILILNEICGQKIKVNVEVRQSTLFTFHHPSDVVSYIPDCVKGSMEYFLDLDKDLVNTVDVEEIDNNIEIIKQDIDQLYTIVKSYHEENQVDPNVIDPQHHSLLPQLRPYQKKAVQWMLHREREPQAQSDKLHPLFTEVKSKDGQILYYNRKGGFLVKEFPSANPLPSGGILADEMGLGKTVEVLSCMLCHPRLDVAKPEPLPVMNISKESRKRRKRQRTPSPTEFQLYEHENDILDDEKGTFSKTLDLDQNDGIMQVDGGQDSDADEMSSEEEYIPVPRSQRSQRNARKVSFQEPEVEPESEEEIPLSQAMKKVAAKKKKKTDAKAKKAKMINTEPKFDPSTVLSNKNITDKSKLEDMILYAIIKKSNSMNGASVGAIKKFLETMFNKKMNEKTNKQINGELVKLIQNGKLLNTSGLKGASGSFLINPDFANFDSRSLYVDKQLDPLDQFIEDLITQRCYEGQPFVETKTKTQLKLEKRKAEKQAKKESLYEKLRPMYELELAGSEVVKPNRGSKKWHGTFFDTKVEQQDFFECICGSDLEADEDGKFRVQCKKCGIYQHAECVRYDVSDPLRGEYYCPHCWTQQEPVESGATLIVSPSSISYQWIEEIQKHIKHKNVRMLFYKGTKASGYIQPRTLANYDIVVTTYQVLQSETNYVDLPHSNSEEGRRFRNPKRFMAIPAPLPCIKWWRMVMDEAQMLESTTSKTAEMALRLKAMHRWCVTGTPIGKSLNDLYGLFMFLNLDPYCLEFWWKKCLFEPYIRGKTRDLEQVLCQLLWRTAKKDVLDQINIPKQTEEIHWLSFSPVEEHFYRRQHIDCSKEAISKIRKFSNQSMKLSEMDRQSLNNLLLPLLRLRQSCCHPQAVKGQFMSLQKSTMTMEELMDQMIKKAKLECEEANRQYIAALNGLAGLDIIEEQYTEAAEKYREVLRIVEEYKDKIKTDTLQKLHTVTNLAELLEAGHEGIAPTLRDDQLRDEARELQSKYLEKYTNAIQAAKEAVDPVTAQVEQLRTSFQIADSWYVKAINSVKSTSAEESILKLVLEEMAQFYDVVNDREFKQMEAKYASSRMVLYKVGEKIAEMDSSRDAVCADLKKLQTSPPEAFLDKAVECHLRMSSVAQKNKEKCTLCAVHDNIEIYESVIFHFVKGEVKALEGKHVRETLTVDETKKLEDAGIYMMDEQRRGKWSDSEAERLLRAILKYAKNALYNKDVIEDGNVHMKLLEAMKKEFRLMRILWRQIYDNVAAVDELNMSIMRLRLRFDDEPLMALNKMKIKKTNEEKNAPDLATRVKEKVETIYILEKHELPSQRLKLIGDKTISINEFKKKNGQLLYLDNLKNSEFGKKGGGENPEPCPICQKALGMQWSVLQCGHCFCVECIRILIEEYSTGGSGGRSVKCAICRSLTHHAEISYVNTKVDHKTEEDSKAYEAVKGSLSTKIEAVVKTLIKIRNDDPNAKALVFSTWNSVLDILESALITNDIQFATLHVQGKFKRNLQKFKNRDDVKVLLLPISSGANGLNLIEASHVLLIEPILNPAQELQAIGRVHRIGQTKATTIHRFLISATIEERIHKMLKSYMHEEKDQSSHSTEENVLTISDLSTLFVDA